MDCQSPPQLSPDRIKILDKIKEYEASCKFDLDLEDDLPGRELKPDEIDYLNKKLSSKINNLIANKLATKFFEGEIKKGNLIIKEVKGLENFLKIKERGAIITCNHFSIYDGYVVYRPLRNYLRKKVMWRVINEANYTSMPGLFGKIMRNCNTLPLSSNKDTMKNFLKAIEVLLKKNEKILVYPEQAMWWNYKKPRPLKPGAFRFAVDNDAPVLPCFVTQKDSEKLAPDGSFYQEYTLNILPPIYPEKDINNKLNAEIMAKKNFEMWVDVYEKTYNKKLSYNE